MIPYSLSDHTIAFKVDPFTLKLDTTVNLPASGKTYFLDPAAGSFHSQSLNLIAPTSVTTISATPSSGTYIDIANADSAVFCR